MSNNEELTQNDTEENQSSQEFRLGQQIPVFSQTNDSHNLPEVTNKESTPDMNTQFSQTIILSDSETSRLNLMSGQYSQTPSINQSQQHERIITHGGPPGIENVEHLRSTFEEYKDKSLFQKCFLKFLEGVNKDDIDVLTKFLLLQRLDVE